jgi:hypothetical protein
MAVAHVSRHLEVQDLAPKVRPVALAREQTLPVLPALGCLLPDGVLQRGTTVAVTRVPGGAVTGTTALALALAAAPSQTGSWTAVVGLPTLGLVAAHELGVVLERLAVIGSPPPEAWATTVAALIGAFDVVLVGVPRSVRVADTRRLAARARERGTVLVQLDERGLPAAGPAGRPARSARSARGELEPDVRLTVVAADWHGLGAGHGHLRGRRVRIEATGRRRAAQPRHAALWLPGPDGKVAIDHAARPAPSTVSSWPTSLPTASSSAWQEVS